MSKILWVFLGLLASPSVALQFASDVSAELRGQLEADLAFVATIRGQQASPLHRSIFGDVDGQAYDRFFRSRVTFVGRHDCGSANAVACVIPPIFGLGTTSKIWLTENYVRFSHPQIARLMILFHEARHTEHLHGFWRHAYCPNPFVDADGNPMVSVWTGAPLAGEPACDETPRGSYGSSLIMLKNIAKFCTNCGDKVRVDAGIYADDQLGRITSREALAAIRADLYERRSSLTSVR
jgi:hypothetical protein